MKGSLTAVWSLCHLACFDLLVRTQFESIVLCIQIEVGASFSLKSEWIVAFTEQMEKAYL